MARQPNQSSELDEIDRDIAIVRDNLRDLTEQAAAYSGAGDEERAAQRIADQEARLADLMKRRDALAKSGGASGAKPVAAAKKPAPSAKPAPGKPGTPPQKPKGR